MLVIYGRPVRKRITGAYFAKIIKIEIMLWLLAARVIINVLGALVRVI